GGLSAVETPCKFRKRTAVGPVEHGGCAADFSDNLELSSPFAFGLGRAVRGAPSCKTAALRTSCIQGSRLSREVGARCGWFSQGLGVARCTRSRAPTISWRSRRFPLAVEVAPGGWVCAGDSATASGR